MPQRELDVLKIKTTTSERRAIIAQQKSHIFAGTSTAYYTSGDMCNSEMNSFGIFNKFRFSRQAPGLRLLASAVTAQSITSGCCLYASSFPPDSHSGERSNGKSLLRNSAAWAWCSAHCRDDGPMNCRALTPQARRPKTEACSPKSVAIADEQNHSRAQLGEFPIVALNSRDRGVVRRRD
jgi:hypothetical protein